MLRVEISVGENVPSHGGPATSVSAKVYVGKMLVNQSDSARYQPRHAKDAGRRYVVDPYIEWAQDLAEELGMPRNSIKLHFNPAAKRLFS